MKNAFHIAATGRPGPVLIDLPKDVAQALIEFKYPASVRLPGYKPTYRGHPTRIHEIAGLIKQSQRPVIYAGGGILSANAAEELLQLAEMISAPVTNTFMGLASFPGDHPLFLGMLGMHGTRYANLAVTECDMLIALGARFDDRVTMHIKSFAPEATVIHIDIDPAEIGKNVITHVPLVGDVKLILKTLLQDLEQTDRSSWLSRIQELKAQYPLVLQQGRGAEAPVCHRTAQPVYPGEGHHCHRCGPASDVGGAVLSVFNGRGLWSPRAAWVLWDSGCRRQSAPASGGPRNWWSW